MPARWTRSVGEGGGTGLPRGFTAPVRRRAIGTMAHEALAPVTRRSPPARLCPSRVPVRGPGRPLEASTRRTMEGSFGVDFSGVRVHDDGDAAAAADGIGAAAFTVGQDIVFGAGEYAPTTGPGRELLAHELAHTVQQRGRLDNAPPLAPGSRLESSAQAAGRAVASGRPVIQALGSGGTGIARQPWKVGGGKEWIDEDLGLEIEAIDEELREALKEKYAHVPQTDYEWLLRSWSIAALQADAERKRQEAREGVYARRSAARAEAQRYQRDYQRARANAIWASQEEERQRVADEASAELAQMGKEAEQSEKTEAAVPAASSARPSRFSPGGFTHDDLRAVAAESEALNEAESKRLDQERKRHESLQRPFDVRLQEARRAPIDDLSLDSRPREVWTYGRSNSLFTDDEQQRVLEAVGAPRREARARARRQEEIRREMEWEAQGERVLAEGQALFLQPFAFGGLARFGVLGRLAAQGYTTYSWAETAVDVRDAVKSGDPARIAGAFGQASLGLLTHRVMRTGEPAPTVELPPERAPTAPGKIGTDPLPVNQPKSAPLIKSSTEQTALAQRAAFEKGGGKVYGSEAELRAEQLAAQSKRAGKLAATSTDPAPGQQPKKYAGLYTPGGDVVTRKGVPVPPEQKVTAAGAVKAKTKAELGQLPKVVSGEPVPAPKPLVGKPPPPVKPGTIGKVLDPSGREVLPGPSVTTRGERPFSGKSAPGSTEYGREGEALTAAHEYPDAVPLGQAKGFNQHEAFDFVVGGEQSVTTPVSKPAAGPLKPGLLIKGGTAISHLELDLGAKTYLNPDAVFKSVRGKIDAAAAYPRTKAWSLGAPEQPYSQYTLIDPERRVVHIAMTKQPTDLQMQALAKARLYAAQKNVELVFVAPH